MTTLSKSVDSLSSDSKPKIRFYFLDALRGIGALWVVLFHLELNGDLTALTSSLPNWVVIFVFKWGFLGVPIFLVLSGFVIAHSLRTAKVDWSYFSRFSVRRFIRLNPPYYASIAVVLCIGFIASEVKGAEFALPSLNNLLAHLVYLQAILGMDQINDVYWTLCLEVQFYVVFCALIGLAQWLDFSKNFNYNLALVFVPTAILAAFWPRDVFENVLFLPHYHSFLLGVFAYWSYTNKLRPSVFYFYCAVLLTLAMGNGLTLVMGDSSFLTIVSVICAILILEVGRADRMHTWLNWSWLQFFGLISYSLYLTHSYIAGAVFFVGYKLINRSVWTEFLMLTVVLTICIVFAMAMWNFVEKPSINLSRKVKLNNKTT